MSVQLNQTQIDWLLTALLEQIDGLQDKNVQLQKSLDRMTDRYIAECSYAFRQQSRAVNAEEKADKFEQRLDNDATAFAQPYGETPTEAQKRCANGAILPDCPISDGALKAIENLK